MKGKLFLIPNLLGECPHDMVIPAGILPLVARTRYFIVENIRSTRRYLKRILPDICIDDLRFFEIDKHEEESLMARFLAPLMEGHNMGLVSEAGVPAVADPGAIIVRMAHRQGIRVVPLTGPSSILLALMASGLNGQSFCFHGYLPVQSKERISKIREIESASRKSNQTQVFMETPYRNIKLLEDLFHACQPDTLVCIATDLSLETEYIMTMTAADWKVKPPDIHKRPTIFLLLGN